MQLVVSQASEVGCEVVELGTPEAGERAAAFYERLGFRNVGARLRWTRDR
jgi:ribosomal protein S18 acetylase RimI-like enzyme